MNKQLFKWLLPIERLPLQGFQLKTALHSPACNMYTVTGGAYPVPLLGAVLSPLLNEIALSGKV